MTPLYPEGTFYKIWTLVRVSQVFDLGLTMGISEKLHLEAYIYINKGYICLKNNTALTYIKEPTYLGIIPVYPRMALIFTDFQQCTWFLLENSQFSTTTQILQILYVNYIYCFPCSKGCLFSDGFFSVMFTQSENTPPHKSRVTLSTFRLITISVSLAFHWAFTSCLIFREEAADG